MRIPLTATPILFLPFQNKATSQNLFRPQTVWKAKGKATFDEKKMEQARRSLRRIQVDYFLLSFPVKLQEETSFLAPAAASHLKIQQSEFFVVPAEIN